MLLYDGCSADPRVRRISAEAFGVWLSALGVANRLGREVVAIAEVDEQLEPRRAAGNDYDLAACVDALVAAELAERLPGEHLRMLARLDLWAFDDDAVNW